MLGFALYGPIAMYSVMAMEAAPSHMAGTAHATVGLAANGKYISHSPALTGNATAHVTSLFL